MSTARRYTPHYTVADYQTWAGDWELWQGIAVSMSPSPFGAHQAMLARLVYELTAAIKLSDCHATVLAEIDWIVRDDTVVRPDVVVVCGNFPDKHLESAPALAVEILSPSTADRDRNHKRLLYEDEGVANYLIVDLDEESLTLYRDSNGWAGEIIQGHWNLSICDDCSLDINVVDLFKFSPRV